MIRIATRSSLRNSKSVHVGSTTAVMGSRGFVNSSKMLNASKPNDPPKEQTLIVKPQTTPIKISNSLDINNNQNNKEKKSKSGKKFSFTGFVLKTAFATAVLYGSTLFIATKNEKVLDFVIDKQLPYYEELLEVIEKGSIDDFKSKFSSFKSRISQLQSSSKDHLDELTQKLENSGEQLLEETKKKLTKAEDEIKKPFEGDDVTPAQQLQKPVEVEAVQKSVEPLPLIKLSNESHKSVDPSVQATIESFNELIRSIDVNSVGPKKDRLIKGINDSISKLTSKLDSLTKNFDDELQSKLKIAQTELLSSYTTKELELTENFLFQFNHEKAQLETKFNQRLNQEIEAAKQTISQAAVNAVSMVRIEQTKKYEQLVQDTINQEREGRLANLENLISRVNELEKFATSLESQFASNHQKSLIQKSLTNLKSLLFSPSEESEPPKLIIPYIQNLTEISKETDDELITLALKNLSPLLAKESNKSILTNSQLLSRWEQLAPELRSASLLPPNAGLLGHLSSLLFSKFLLPVKGTKPDGKDIESVIGRVEYSLSRGQLDIAVEEAANLKGWSRELARDWVIEGRKRLEAEFLINLIDTETKIL